MAHPTGFSVPPSELDSSIQNISSSSGSTTVRLAPTKKLKSTAGVTVAISAQAGSPVAPALVATIRNVELHTATQTNNISSGSSISVSSSASRLRRVDLARAKLALAKARSLEAKAHSLEAEAQLEMVKADDEFAASSHADSAGRRIEDVQSEAGSITDPPTTLNTDGAHEAPPTRDNPFNGAFVERKLGQCTVDIRHILHEYGGTHH